MADIKKFTGYIAPDGTTHNTVKQATDHTRELKIKEALVSFKDVTEGINEGVSDGECQGPVVYAEDLPKFLFAHKDAILNAFTQEVNLRAPRRKKVAAPAVVAA